MDAGVRVLNEMIYECQRNLEGIEHARLDLGGAGVGEGERDGWSGLTGSIALLVGKTTLLVRLPSPSIASSPEWVTLSHVVLQQESISIEHPNVFSQ